MPSAWLPVPAHKQSRAGRCLPACARMVLDYLGDQRSEDDLARRLHTRTFGTPANNIQLLESLGYSVTFGKATLDQLQEYLTRNIPPIVFVQTGNLPYWQENVNHAIVLVGVDANEVAAIDPAFGSVQHMPVDNFLLAWLEFDDKCAVITKR